MDASSIKMSVLTLQPRFSVLREELFHRELDYLKWDCMLVVEKSYVGASTEPCRILALTQKKVKFLS